MKLLLLGAGGFVGANLVDDLLAATDHRIDAVDLSSEKMSATDDPRFCFHKADIRWDHPLVTELVAGADVVVNLVATTGPAASCETPLEVIDVDFSASARVVQTCAGFGVRLVQFSTSEIYGHPSGAAYDEHESELRLGPVGKARWVYAAANQLLERLIHGHGAADDLDFTILRPFNLVGPRFDHLVPAGAMGGPRVFAHFMSALLTGGPMYLVDGGFRRRTFTHVDDANAAVRTVLHHPAARGGTFNVGNPANTTTIREIAELMLALYEELTGSRPACELVPIDAATFYGPEYEDVDRVPPDVTRLRGLGWEPRFDLRATFRDAMTHYL